MSALTDELGIGAQRTLLIFAERAQPRLEFGRAPRHEATLALRYEQHNSPADRRAEQDQRCDLGLLRACRLTNGS